MENIYKIVALVLLTLLGFGGDTIAYDYTVVNRTGRDIKVQLKYAFGKNFNEIPFEIKAGKQHKFSYPIGKRKGSLCLEKIMVKVKEKGKWGKLKKAEIDFRLSSSEYSLALGYPASYIGTVRKERSLCRNRVFELRFIDGKLEARALINGKLEARARE